MRPFAICGLLAKVATDDKRNKLIKMNVEMLDKEVFEPEEEVKYECERCQDTGFVEEMGDGENFEWDVIGHSRCSCNED